jgi:hypothetical protein
VVEKSARRYYTTDVIQENPTRYTIRNLANGNRKESYRSDILSVEPPKIPRGINTSSKSRLSRCACERELTCRERIYAEREELVPLFKAGGKVYICGSPALAEGVKGAVVRIWSERKGKTQEEGREWLQALGKERFATDVFI